MVQKRTLSIVNCYREYLNMNFWYTALFKEVNVDKLIRQHAGKKREMVWLFIYTPVHLCTGGRSKEGSKNNHRIKNKQRNQQLPGFRSFVFPFNDTEVEKCHVCVKIPVYR